MAKLHRQPFGGSAEDARNGGARSLANRYARIIEEMGRQTRNRLRGIASQQNGRIPQEKLTILVWLGGRESQAIGTSTIVDHASDVDDSVVRECIRSHNDLQCDINDAPNRSTVNGGVSPPARVLRRSHIHRTRPSPAPRKQGSRHHSRARERHRGTWSEPIHLCSVVTPIVGERNAISCEATASLPSHSSGQSYESPRRRVSYRLST
jgi:hypothetical protein